MKAMNDPALTAFMVSIAIGLPCMVAWLTFNEWKEKRKDKK